MSPTPASPRKKTLALHKKNAKGQILLNGSQSLEGKEGGVNKKAGGAPRPPVRKNPSTNGSAIKPLTKKAEKELERIRKEKLRIAERAKEKQDQLEREEQYSLRIDAARFTKGLAGPREPIATPYDGDGYIESFIGLTQSTIDHARTQKITVSDFSDPHSLRGSQTSIFDDVDDAEDSHRYYPWGVHHNHLRDSLKVKLFEANTRLLNRNEYNYVREGHIAKWEDGTSESSNGIPSIEGIFTTHFLASPDENDEEKIEAFNRHEWAEQGENPVSYWATEAKLIKDTQFLIHSRLYHDKAIYIKYDADSDVPEKKYQVGLLGLDRKFYPLTAEDLLCDVIHNIDIGFIGVGDKKGEVNIAVNDDGTPFGLEYRSAGNK
jgi:hypothetical protein